MAQAPPRTRPLEVVVIADVHLGTREARADELLEYLESITPNTLVIAGDLVNLDTLASRRLPDRHFEVLKRILDLAQAGTRVFYLRGNHELPMRKLQQLSLGNLHLRRNLTLHVGGAKHYIFHGDSLDAALKYGLPLSSLRGVVKRVVGVVDRGLTSLYAGLGKKRWSLAREVKTDPESAAAYVSVFKRSAAELAHAQDCNHVICAHIHQPSIEHVDLGDRTVRYLNPGDWTDSLTALEFRNDRWSIRRYDRDDFPRPSDRLRVPRSVSNRPEAEPAARELISRLMEIVPARKG